MNEKNVSQAADAADLAFFETLADRAGAPCILYPAGTLLYKEGEPLQDVLLIFSGNVQLFVNVPDGGHVRAGVAGPGEALGLIAVMAGSAAQVSARTRGEVRVARIPAEVMRKFVSSDPSGYLGLARLLSRSGAVAQQSLAEVKRKRFSRQPLASGQ